jgi:hypothetical protein
VGDRGQLWVRMGCGRNMIRLKKWKGMFMEANMTRDVNTFRRQVKTIIN